MASQEDYLDELLQSLTENQDNDTPTEPDEEMNVADLDALLQSVIDSHEADTDFTDVPGLEETPAGQEPVDVTAVEEEEVPVEEQLSGELPTGEDTPIDVTAVEEEEVPLEEQPIGENMPIDVTSVEEEEAPLEELPTGESTPVDVTAVEEAEVPQKERPAEEDIFAEPSLDDMMSLDDLLADVGFQQETPQDEEEPQKAHSGSAAGTATVEDTAEMTAEEIASLLAASQSEETPQTAPAEQAAALSEEDMLAGMLNETDDADLKEIQELLQKADNNEEIVGEPEEALPVQEETSRAQQRKLQREAKKEAKRAAKEARKAQKEAKKAEKAALKKQKPEQETQGVDGEAASVLADGGLTEEEAIFLGDGAAEGQKAQTGVQAAAAEDALLKELEGFDFLNDISLGEAGKSAETDSAGDDSLAQGKEGEGQAKSKKGLFARFLDFISEEEEEEPENEEIKLSDENQNILKDLDKEKNKKGKKAKKKKGAKSEGENGGEGENAENETDNDKKKKKSRKAKKEKKPKEENQPGEEAAPAPVSGKKIPVRQIVIVAVVCASVGAAIILFVQIVGDYSAKQAGRRAYYEEDYQTCYQNLFGKDLNETEQVMYSKSESILTISIWLKEYELLAEEGQEVKALDSLLQSVYDYPTLYAYAVAWNADAEVSEIYNQMLTILSEKYHLTEAQAQEIANNSSDIEYTRMVMAIAQGESYGSWNQEEVPAEEPEELTNPLPEESELETVSFIDNR